MQRWNWFMSADVEGKWVSINGHAEIEVLGGQITATLWVGPDRRAGVHHEVRAEIDDEDYVRAEVTSPGRNIEPFHLQGVLFRGQRIDGVESLTAFLTDGTTVLGLTHGPRSHERNM